MPEENEVTTPTSEDSSTSDDLSIDEVSTTEETAPEDSKETSETPETTEAKPATANQQPAEPFVTVKYNGAEKGLSREDAIALAQKGMNYDKIQQRLQAVEQAERVFEEQAKNAGLSVQEYAERLNQFQEQSSINSIAQQFMAENPDVSEEAANAYAKQVYENNKLKNQRQEQEQAVQSQQTLQSRVQGDIQTFMQAFPDVKIDNTFPVEVIDDVRNGTPLMQAYLAYQNKQMKAQLAALQTNKKNASKSVGSVADNTGDAKGDAFLEGLLEKD